MKGDSTRSATGPGNREFGKNRIQFFQSLLVQRKFDADNSLSAVSELNSHHFQRSFALSHKERGLFQGRENVKNCSRDQSNSRYAWRQSHVMLVVVALRISVVPMSSET